MRKIFFILTIFITTICFGSDKSHTSKTAKTIATLECAKAIQNHDVESLKEMSLNLVDLTEVIIDGLPYPLFMLKNLMPNENEIQTILLRKNKLLSIQWDKIISNAEHSPSIKEEINNLFINKPRGYILYIFLLVKNNLLNDEVNKLMLPIFAFIAKNFHHDVNECKKSIYFNFNEIGQDVFSKNILGLIQNQILAQCNNQEDLPIVSKNKENFTILFDYINNLEKFPFFWDQVFQMCLPLFENKAIKDIAHPDKKMHLSNYLILLPNVEMKLALFTKLLNMCNDSKSELEGLNVTDPNDSGNIFMGLAKLDGQEDLFFSCMLHLNKIMGRKRDHFSNRNDFKYLNNNSIEFPTNVGHIIGGFFLE